MCYTQEVNWVELQNQMTDLTVHVTQTSFVCLWQILRVRNTAKKILKDILEFISIYFYLKFFLCTNLRPLNLVNYYLYLCKISDFIYNIYC